MPARGTVVSSVAFAAGWIRMTIVARNSRHFHTGLRALLDARIEKAKTPGKGEKITVE